MEADMTRWHVMNIGMVLAALLALAMLGACATEDGDDSDGDAPVYDGDTTDGDLNDGDEPDGDIASDGDISDGDVPDGDAPDGDQAIDGDDEDLDGDDTSEDGDTSDGDASDGDLSDGDIPSDCGEDICVDNGWRDSNHCLEDGSWVSCGRQENGCPVLVEQRDCAACCVQDTCHDKRVVYGTVMRKDPVDFADMVGTLSYTGKLRVAVNDGPRDQGQLVQGKEIGDADYTSPSTRIAYWVELEDEVAAGQYHLAAFLDANGNSEADKGDIATFNFIVFDLPANACVEVQVLMDVVIPF
jgi:hypothetical protein